MNLNLNIFHKTNANHPMFNNFKNSNQSTGMMLQNHKKAKTTLFTEWFLSKRIG